MYKVYLVLLFFVGVINFLPIIGLLSLDKINQLYDLTVTDQKLGILLRHRALLFGLIGGFMVFSIFKPQYQSAAMVLAGGSMLGYLYLFWSMGSTDATLLKITQIDIVGAVLLVAAVVVKYCLNES